MEDVEALSLLYCREIHAPRPPVLSLFNQTFIDSYTPQTERDEAREKRLDNTIAQQHPEAARQYIRLSTTQCAGHNPMVLECLKTLDCSHGPFPAPLNRGQSRKRHTAGSYRTLQKTRSNNSILNGVVDADSTRRRHYMPGIANH